MERMPFVMVRAAVPERLTLPTMVQVPPRLSVFAEAVRPDEGQADGVDEEEPEFPPPHAARESVKAVIANVLSNMIERLLDSIANPPILCGLICGHQIPRASW